MTPATRCTCQQAAALTALVIEVRDPWCDASAVHDRTEGRTGVDPRQAPSAPTRAVSGRESGTNGDVA